ncbi:hypothetical protein LQ327_21165 [Actinomycetospora endophytica]|uniref:YbaB/EbfC DNA-binding family protein n=1 Tax=Actinomycetospora endophytica TaxID=2291215 RepID=A0ABS8PC71_9PSEU|nr:hypothetical protein [Actinomycetospora endophytica]MCD2195884.1 hypothetical protein [Actinomycetospora endophytica]
MTSCLPAPDGSAVALRAAIESMPEGEPGQPMPQFSQDGGVTLSDVVGHSARVQPLGQRARISILDADHMVAEAEVDLASLVAGFRAGGDAYSCAAQALRRENGPLHR